MADDHRSYSQLHSWLECGMAYRLERIDKVPCRPGVWLPAGTAVHRCIEEYLHWRLAQPVADREEGRA
jgi:hypothetical protein